MMKRFTGTTLSLCLCLTAAAVVAQTVETDTDVVFIDASVTSETGELLTMYGPYLWAAQHWGLDNPPDGSNLRVDITLSDGEGNPLYVGSVDGVTLTVPAPPPPPPGPFPPPPLPPIIPVDLIAVPEGVMIAGPAGTFMVSLEPVAPAVVEVAVDIKPRSDRNPFNVRSHGVLPVAILGASDFNVRDIDVTTLTVAGVAPRFALIADVAGNYDHDGCGGDGYPDLYLFVKSRDLAAVLGSPEHGSVLTLDVVGAMDDGTPVIGSDAVTVLNKKVRQPRTHKLSKRWSKRSKR